MCKTRLRVAFIDERFPYQPEIKTYIFVVASSPLNIYSHDTSCMLLCHNPLQWKHVFTMFSFMYSSWHVAPPPPFHRFFQFECNAESWPVQLWLTCTSACVCLCVYVSVHPHVRLSAHAFSSTCTPVCLCCYCVRWLQFTQIWPYCRQVSLLWEVLQWDPGQQCEPGRRPGAAADVSCQSLGVWELVGDQLWDFLAFHFFFALSHVSWR